MHTLIGSSENAIRGSGKPYFFIDAATAFKGPSRSS
jgi:hypothetical protein